MTSTEQKLMGIIIALDSTNKKEKLDALENVINLLNQNDIVQSLHKKTIAKDNKISWDVIFLKVHNALISIIDENGMKSRQLSDKNMQFIQNTIYLIIQKSVYQKAMLINSNIVVSSILAVFATDFRSKCLGSVYLNIYSKYIIGERRSWNQLKEEHWIGMKGLCEKLVKRPPDGTQIFFFLEALCDIIKNSSKNCQISHNFLNLFDFIKEFFINYKSVGAKTEIVLIRLTNMLCLQLALEFRFKVCEFAEDVFDYIVSYQGNNTDLNVLVNHFLIITLTIHNPSGVYDKDKSFYAFNFKKWILQIKKIYYLCWISISDILKNSSFEISLELLNLFIEVSHLIFAYKIDESFDPSDDEISLGHQEPIKKRKLLDTSVHLLKSRPCQPEPVFQNLVSNLLGADGWFWLKFLEFFLCKYPSDVKQLLPSIIQALCQLFYSKKNESLIRGSLRCLCRLVEAEKVLELSEKNVLLINEAFASINSELLRCLVTKNCSEAHILVQTLIRYSKLVNCGPLLQLYCNETLKGNLDDFKTLTVICKNCLLPEVIILDNQSQQKNVRETLLLWLINRNENYPCEDLAKLLVALILKKFDEDVVKKIDKGNILVTHSTVNDFCQLITQYYEILALKSIKFVAKSKSQNDNLMKLRIDKNLEILLLKLLKEKWKQLFEALTNDTCQPTFDDKLIVLQKCYWFCELMCYLFSNTKKIRDSTMNNSNLLEKLEILLNACTSRTLNLLKIKFFDLSSLSKIYTGNFIEEIHKIIREPKSINLNLLQFFLEIFSNSNSNPTDFIEGVYGELKSYSEFTQLINSAKSIFHFKNLTEKEKIFIVAAELLCQYIVIPSSSYSNKYQITLGLKIINHLLENIGHIMCTNFQLQLVLRVVYSFSKYDGISVLILNGCIKLLTEILKRNPHEPEISIMTLEVLKNFLPAIYDIEDLTARKNYLTILEDFKDKISRKRQCGTKAISKFLECLAEVCKFDPELSWTICEEDGSCLTVAEYFLTFLLHSHHEVRITVAQLIGSLFITSNKTQQNIIMHQKKLLKSLILVLSKNESLYPKQKDCIYNYAACAISSASLISLAGIICQSNFWQKEAFFYLIYLAFLKKIKKSEVNDILNLVCKNLHINSQEDYFITNLHYFLGRWAKKELDIRNFPFYILGYNTLEEFLLEHHCEIILIYSQMGYIDIVRTIAGHLGKSMSEILQNCTPMISAFIFLNMQKLPESKVEWKIMKLKELVDEYLLAETFKECTEKQLNEILFYMIKNLHDPAYLKELCNFFGNIEDDFNLLGFTTVEIVSTVANFSSARGKPLLEVTILENPSIVEKVSSCLLENIFRSILYQDKVFAFYKYIFFMEMISNITQNDKQFYSINAFIIRDVIFSLKAIIQSDKSETLTNMACVCLEKLAKAYLEKFSEIFGEFLPVVTTILIPLVLKSNAKALNLLNYLICGNYLKLEKYIILLDPFPSHDTFNKINQLMTQNQIKKVQSLKSNIEHFLQAGSIQNSGSRVEGLKHLRKGISEKKDEIKEMYDALTTSRGFSEDCKQSLLHQLISMLVQLTTHEDIKVKIEAAKCLGELGPSDLTTLILQPDNKLQLSSPLETPIDALFKLPLNYLSDLLTTGNYWVKKAAINALYAILKIKEARDVLQSNAKEFKNFEYLHLFQSGAHNDLRLKIEKDILVKVLKNQTLWKPDIHEKWITKLVDGLLQCLSDSTGIINSFRALIVINWEFAEHLLPLLLDLILYSKDNDCSEIINENFRSFFINNFNRENKSKNLINKKSVQCLLNVVDYIRTQRHHEGIYQESCLGINYLYFAEAALYCSAFFTSIFYAEVWFEQKRKDIYSQVDVNTIWELFPEESFILTQILRECYSKLGNSDGIHGCGYMHILESSAEIQHYEHMEKWNLSLLHHDIQLSMGNKSFEKGLMNSLENSGMYYILNSIVKTSDFLSMNASMQYKCATMLSDWSLLDTALKTKNSLAYETFHKSFYFALKAFHNEDDVTFHCEIQNAIKNVLNKLVDCSLESSKNLYSPIAKLQMIKELEEFFLVLRQNPNKSDLWNLFGKWQKQNAIKCADFKLKESILTSRTIFLKMALQNAKNSPIENDLREILCLTYSSAIISSRKEKEYKTALRMLNYVGNLEKIPRDVFEKLQIEKSRILWDKGDKEIGKYLLNHIIKKKGLTGNLKARGLRIYGDWMAKTKSENSKDIISNYYLKSISFSGEEARPIEAYASLAKFADMNYEQLNEYFSSPLFEIKQNLLNTQQDLASELRQELGCDLTVNREKRMAYQIAFRQSVIDENEIKNNKAERDSYLCLALKYYLLSLREGEKYNLFIFRIISLWMSNSSQEDVTQCLKKMLPEIPSYKFLPLLPQLIPRMTDIYLISNLVERIFQDHPYHTLPLLSALSNSYEDMKYTGSRAPIATPRVQAAKSMLEKFMKYEKLKPLIQEMNDFSNALIELANYQTPERVPPGGNIEFPDHLKIKRIRKLSNIAIPSLTVPYKKDGRYEGIVGIEKFEKNYHTVGGINLPKKINCIGTDGISRPLLVKGKDDLRQDAVMQQVFTIMNSLLSQNTETRKRKLVIRTYKVLPLSQRSGIIEWCENTQPLSLYLTGLDGKSGAHKRFYAEDFTALECRSLIRKVFAEPGVTNEDKLKVFLDICKRFHPVFHYFFLEKFSAAGVWFERRLAYIHSVATSSMIGYILGLGDRHVHNILIDNLTAEVIHIDLGVAFEQGKTLPIPETVPFRLTRDIVDGMGLSGIEGDFRISCIKTMEVLRENQDTILTLLEVLLYDPLYTWTITPEKAYLMQGHLETSSSTTENSSPSPETNKLAERALIRMKQKFEGTESSWVATNIEGQISYLIQQARDPSNLSRMFHGWQAYL